MPLSRTSFIRGPAIVQFDGATFYTKGDVEVEIGLATFGVETSIHGKVDDRVSERSVRVRFTPSGEWEALTVLWPYASTAIGSSIFTASDKPLVIQGADGRKVTIQAAAVTKMPDITLSTTKTLIGQVEFSGVGKDAVAWTTANSLIAEASNAFSDTTFDPANIKTQPYTAAWGAVSPWSSFETLEGFTVSFETAFGDVATDTDGIIDMTLGGLSVVARCQPVGITAAQMIAAAGIQDTGAYRGRSLQTGANDLVISASGVVVRVKKANIRSAGLRWGNTTHRIGEIEFVATREFSAGVPQALFSVGTS